MINIIQSVLSIIVVVNIILGLVIFSRGIKSLSDIIFGLISLSSALWGIAIIGFYSIQYKELFNWILVTHASALLISFLFLIFSLNFPQRIDKNTKIYFFSITIFSILNYLLFFTDYIIGNIIDNSYKINNGYVFYALAVIFYFIIGFVFLLIQIKKSHNPVQKAQTQYVLIGSLIASTLAIIPDLILPYFGFFDYTWLGPIFTLIMVVSLFIAMLRYDLFNIKLIFTEITSLSIVIALLIEIFFVKSISELILKVTVLIILTVFSYLLIKSVYREINQRERIEVLAKDLQKANDRLRELDKQKSEFVSFATHQLRAPLTAMKGYASLILEGDLGKLSRDIRGAISRIYDSSNTLTNIVDDYLNISRIELGTMKYSFEMIDLKELLTNVIAELKPNIEKSKLSFSLNVDNDKKYMIYADKDKFKQIVANLVDNSIKYTPSGSVVVSLEKKIEQNKKQNIDNAMKGSEGKIIFSVKDTGIGIAPDVMPKLFAKFTRATNGTKQNIHGTGLGLYVAKEIVTAHKGKIWAESAGEGKGSTFNVELEEGV